MTFHTSRTDLQLGRIAGEVEISPNADLSASAVAGPVVLNTRNRNITLDRVSGDLTVTNRNGSVDLTCVPPLGNVVIENQNGSVDVTLPGNSGFVLQANTTDGDLQNEFSLPMRDDDDRKSLQGTVGSGGPSIRVTTTQGDISLKRGDAGPLPPAPPSPPKLTSIPDVEKPISGISAAALRQTREQIRVAKDQVRAAQEELAARKTKRDAQNDSDLDQ